MRIIKLENLRRLFGLGPRPHRHLWETTHVNKWQHPTRQACACGMTRSIESTLSHPHALYAWDWVYSDGTRSVHTRGMDQTDWGNHLGFDRPSPRIEIADDPATPNPPRY